MSEEQQPISPKKFDDAALDEYDSQANQKALREERDAQQKERAEFARERAEKNKRMEEHKQRVKALEEAEYKAFDLDRAKCADELMWLDFETRTRNLINQIVQPALRLSIEDRETNIELELENRKLKTRLELVEQCVFQEKKYGAKRTIFDDFNDKIDQIQTQVTEETLKLHDTQKAHKEDIDTRLFNQDQRIDNVQQVLDQIKYLEQNITKLQEHIKKVIGDVMNDFTTLKKTNLEELINQQRQITFESNRVERHENQIKRLNAELEAQIEKLQNKSEHLDQLEQRTQDMQQNKVETSAAEKSFGKVQKQITKIKTNLMTIDNQQSSLENWVEKYLPLKLHHLIVETVGEVLAPEQQQRYYEVSKQMSRILRKEILEDQGVSKLKYKVLDLLSNLRLEQQILNDGKTGPNTKKQKVTKPPEPSKTLMRDKPEGVSDTEHLQNLAHQKEKAEKKGQPFHITSTNQVAPTPIVKQESQSRQSNQPSPDVQKSEKAGDFLSVNSQKNVTPKGRDQSASPQVPPINLQNSTNMQLNATPLMSDPNVSLLLDAQSDLQQQNLPQQLATVTSRTQSKDTPTWLKNNLQFDLDGTDGDNILWLYNEITFVPKRLQYQIEQNYEDILQILDQRISELEHKTLDNIENNSQFILQNKQNIDSNLSSIKKNSQQMQQQHQIAMAAFNKIQLDQVFLEKESAKTKQAAIALYDQANFVEQALLQIMGAQLTEMNSNPLKVNTNPAQVKEQASTNLSSLKGLGDALHRCKRLLMGPSSTNTGQNEVRASYDKTYVQSTENTLSIRENPAVSIELYENTQRSIMSEGKFESSPQNPNSFIHHDFFKDNEVQPPLLSISSPRTDNLRQRPSIQSRKSTRGANQMIFSSESIQKKLKPNALEELPKPRTAGVGAFGSAARYQNRHNHIPSKNTHTFGIFVNNTGKRESQMHVNPIGKDRDLNVTSSRETRVFPDTDQMSAFKTYNPHQRSMPLEQNQRKSSESDCQSLFTSSNQGHIIQNILGEANRASQDNIQKSIPHISDQLLNSKFNEGYKNLQEEDNNIVSQGNEIEIADEEEIDGLTVEERNEIKAAAFFMCDLMKTTTSYHKRGYTTTQQHFRKKQQPQLEPLSHRPFLVQHSRQQQNTSQLQDSPRQNNQSKLQSLLDTTSVLQIKPKHLNEFQTTKIVIKQPIRQRTRHIDEAPKEMLGINSVMDKKATVTQQIPPLPLQEDSQEYSIDRENKSTRRSKKKRKDSMLEMSADDKIVVRMPQSPKTLPLTKKKYSPRLPYNFLENLDLQIVKEQRQYYEKIDTRNTQPSRTKKGKSPRNQKRASSMLQRSELPEQIHSVSPHLSEENSVVDTQKSIQNPDLRNINRDKRRTGNSRVQSINSISLGEEQSADNDLTKIQPIQLKVTRTIRQQESANSIVSSEHSPTEPTQDKHVYKLCQGYLTQRKSPMRQYTKRKAQRKQELRLHSLQESKQTDQTFNSTTRDEREERRKKLFPIQIQKMLQNAQRFSVQKPRFTTMSPPLTAAQPQRYEINAPDLFRQKNNSQMQSSRFVCALSPETGRHEMRPALVGSNNTADSIDMGNLTNPMYSKAAKNLRRRWEYKKKQLQAINTDQLKTKEFVGLALPLSQQRKQKMPSSFVDDMIFSQQKI